MHIKCYACEEEFDSPVVYTEHLQTAHGMSTAELVAHVLDVVWAHREALAQLDKKVEKVRAHFQGGLEEVVECFKAFREHMPNTSERRD